MSTALVVGMGVTGKAVARRLLEQGWSVSAYDDRAEVAATDGVEVLSALPETLSVDLVVPSPGVPESHPVYALAARSNVAVVSEIELAWRAAAMPVIAVTGTNGKTTVTTMIAAILAESGITAVAGGNIGLPLIDAVTQPVQAVVAEVSSFQLQYTAEFKPAVAVWLNFAEDHLDWHPSLEEYAAAKARIWRNQSASDTAVVNADDPVVMRWAASAPSALVTFGDGGSWHCADGALVDPEGEVVVEADELVRSLPHDIANALAACAAAVAAGASLDACRSVLRTFAALPHRVELVSDAGGVRWYDDSKATTPASVVAALRGFDSVVLIAGGRNKGLDLGALAVGADRVRSVVAIGDAAGEVAAAFEGVRPVAVAESMAEAVDLAHDAAEPGDAVLLSPGCASFDWYGSYAERGEDFARLVKEKVGA